ncbi:MAG: carbon-nitrogen hydrolase family protein [Gemmatimonadetes bacterium]|uniref:Carbon-nitrogen hydrolase family protein n=1 Tax=Candidatus Kutchimonas denitrificans TaxID=3056748 RepID=A0AAE4Z9C1_9BACT|nr:carbon-nitrogen hydrolase family protein [Gemmatimonadota bacterium]NIR76043.1 carbon-nitrogen hydrolase family protein [Candidatus Kutchimonas denitrificans]NIS02235.1 carbon-nitrogen hydrolase family protein [Gemmatimonadota bacterium]NIT68061.1 carbon-nitrogen hydrolase family protein [Gemmatimonadota bacterium]NIU54087.1 carbon-nitrogen hydrolase family protein [Gemmatimonadota bacterium]
MKVACAQFAHSGDREGSRDRAIEWMARAADEGADVIVFPELAFDFFFPQVRADARYFDWAEPIPGPTTKRFQEAAARHGLVTVINVFERAGPGRYYDASPVIDADGRLVGVSRMLHIAEEPGYNEKFYYWPGDTGWPVHLTSAGPIGVAICYDRHYPEHFRALALGGAELVVVPTATSTSEQAFRDIWELEIRAAAVANQIFVAVANRAGQDGELQFFGASFVAGPGGEVVARADGDGEQLLVAPVDRDRIEEVRRHVPFLRDLRYDLYGSAPR